MRFILALILFAPVGCVSTQKPSRVDYFGALSAIPIGADQSTVVRELGVPASTEDEFDSTKITYSFSYKKFQIPKAIVWSDRQGRVTTMHLKLFKETGDAMSLADIERSFGKLNLELQAPPNLNQRHHIASERTLVDNKLGIRLEVKGERYDQVSTITWFTPSPGNPSVTSSDEK